MFQYFNGRHDVVFFSGYLVKLAIDRGTVGGANSAAKTRHFKSFDLISGAVRPGA